MEKRTKSVLFQKCFMKERREQRTKTVYNAHVRRKIGLPTRESFIIRKRKCMQYLMW